MRSICTAALLAGLAVGLALPAVAQQAAPQEAPGGVMGQGQMMGQGGMMGRGMMPGQGRAAMMQQRGMGGCPMMGMGPMMGMRGMMGGPMMGGPGRHIEGRLAFLKTELAITPEQEALWSAFADALRSSAASMQAMHETMMADGPPATPPEHMQRHAEMMAAHLAALEQVREAATPLYDALSPEQKETADDLMGMM